jgi:hypothetical protein
MSTPPIWDRRNGPTMPQKIGDVGTGRVAPAPTTRLRAPATSATAVTGRNGRAGGATGSGPRAIADAPGGLTRSWPSAG